MASRASIAWSGVFSALATPFAPDGSVDRAQLEALIDLLILEGVTGFVVAGSTGEYYSQSKQERIALFESVKRHVAGRVRLIAGTSALARNETLELTRAARDIGFDGCMVLPPVYCLPTPKEVLAYFGEIDELGLPIMVYNNPARVGVGISPSLASSLAGLDNVVAYKESARDLYVVAETYYATAGRLRHFVGLEPYASALLSRGAVGIVSTISNVAAREVVACFKAFHANDAVALSRNQKVIDQLYHLLSQSGLSNFAFVKSAMAGLGRPGGDCRLPHHMADGSQLANIKNAVKRIYAESEIPLAT
jgi:4-hydroxy-tetrahydrodipicolinate synthase